MSETPRTDAIAEWGQRDFGDKWIGSSWHSAEIVPSEFARDLERELAAKSAEMERLRKAIKQQAALIPLVPTSPAGTYARGYDSGMRDTITAISMALEAK